MATEENHPSQENTTKRGRRWALKTLVALAIFGVPGGYFLFGGGFEAWHGSPAVTPGQRMRRETRPTLSPALFVGKAATTHQIAQDIPDILDQLYCYCGCDKTSGHKSLLSCYTDGHAPT
jgi:hypothetical protein